MNRWSWALWQLWAEIAGGRQGDRGLSATEIKDWCILTRTTLDPWEVRAIRRIDDACRKEFERQREAKAKREKAEPLSGGRVRMTTD